MRAAHHGGRSDLARRLGAALAQPAGDCSAHHLEPDWRAEDHLPRSSDPHDADVARNSGAAIVEGDETCIRCRLDDEASSQRFPVLRELADAGGRDYVIYRVDHPESLATTQDTFWRRQWISFTSDVLFTAEHLALFESLLPAISCRLALETTNDAARSLLPARSSRQRGSPTRSPSGRSRSKASVPRSRSTLWLRGRSRRPPA